MRARIFAMVFGLVLNVLPAAAAQSDRVVALVVSVGDGAERADAIQTQLQLMGAETLRSDEPNNAELRSILTRFAREAANSRATFVYLDVPVITFEGRRFILPDAATLERPTDLFTQAIPIQAFSRSAAQAEQGGAVALTVVDTDQPLLAGLSVAKTAPEPIPGASPVLFASVGAFGPILATFEAAANKDEIEVGDMLQRMAVQENVTVSDFPRNLIYLREPRVPEVVPEPIALPEPVSQAAPSAETASAPRTETEPAATETPDPQETLEELELLEQALSRAAKRSVQRQLRRLGHYKGLVDGIFGPQTREAIRAFQSNRSEDETGVLTRRQLLDLSS